MSILQSHIVFYGSASMNDTDSGAEGGAADTSRRVVFDPLSANDNVQVVSSAAGDTTQTVTVSGLNAPGENIAEGKTLTGLTPVPMTANTVWERIFKAIKSATTAGDVAVERVTAARANTAVGGAQSTASEMAYITLDASASASDDFYLNMVVRITGGTGVGQIRRVIAYRGSDKRAWVDRDWDVLVDGTSTFTIAEGLYFEKSPNEILEVRVPFYDVAADVAGGAARDYYTKIFAYNNHGTLSLTSATIAEQADPSGNVDFGLAATLDDTATTTNRTTAPGGITFDSATKNVANSQNHTAGAGQGIWLHLNLPAGEAAAKTSYTLRESGVTT